MIIVTNHLSAHANKISKQILRLEITVISKLQKPCKLHHHWQCEVQLWGGILEKENHFFSLAHTSVLVSVFF